VILHKDGIRMRRLTVLIVIWLVSACIFAIGAAMIIKPTTDYRLSADGIPTQGVVTATEPQNHEIIRYSYKVGGQAYSGVGHGGNGNPDFVSIRAGQQVLVYYDANNPQVSTLGYPKNQLQVNLTGIIFAALVGPTIIVISLIRRGFLSKEKLH
jgi:hypothetical protein